MRALFSGAGLAALLAAALLAAAPALAQQLPNPDFRTTMTGGSFARRSADRDAELPSVLEFIPAGTTYSAFLADATPTLQNAATTLCARSPKGGALRVPGMTFVLPATASITFACPIKWLGQGWNEVAAGGGTYFHITGTAVSPFSLTDPAARGTSFEDIGVYQDQPAPGTGWAPTVYPPVFSLANVAGVVRFRNILSAPVYDLIKADQSGRLEPDGLYGQVLHTAVAEDRAYDTTHFAGPVHLWAFWSADSNVLTWQQANADELVLSRVDGLEAPDVFIFACRSALKLQRTANTSDATSLPGFTTKGHFGTLYADGCKFGIWNTIATGSAAYQRPQIRVENFEHTGIAAPAFATAIPGSRGLQVDAAGAIDASFGRFSSEFVSTPINLDSTTVGSRLRIGDLYTAVQTSLPAIVAAGASINDIAIATPAITQNGVLTNNIGMASFKAPLRFGGLISITSGGTLAMTSDVDGYVLSAGGTVAAYSLTLPAAPYDGQELSVSSTVVITSMTVGVNGASGQAIGGPAATTLGAGATVRYRYSSSGGNSVWLRVQ